MNLRERIADWISGGALTRALAHTKNVKVICVKAIDRLDRQQEMNGKNLVRLAKARSALRAIIAQEKPTSNATVRRICNIARSAMSDS